MTGTVGIANVGLGNSVQPTSSVDQSATGSVAFDQMLEQAVEEMMLEDTASLASSIGDDSSSTDSAFGSASPDSLWGTGASAFSPMTTLLSMLPNYTGLMNNSQTDDAGVSIPSPANTISSAAPIARNRVSESSKDSVQSLVASAASKYNIPTSILNAVIQQESGFDPNAVSSAGALGLMQLMPSTAATLGVTNPFDPAENIDGGARYLSQLLQQFNGSVPLALAAYNAGPNAVTEHGGIPPYEQTEQYVQSILAMSGMPD